MIDVANVVDAVLPKETLWQRMEHARIKNRLSKAEIEKAIGIGRKYYACLEKVGFGMRVGTLVKFCELTGVSPSRLVYGGSPSIPKQSLSGETVGEKIRSLRETHGLSQGDFAKAIGYKNKTGNVYLWENNKHEIKLATLLKISEAFQINVESFLATQKPDR